MTMTTHVDVWTQNTKMKKCITCKKILTKSELCNFSYYLPKKCYACNQKRKDARISIVFAKAALNVLKRNDFLWDLNKVDKEKILRKKEKQLRRLEEIAYS